MTEYELEQEVLAILESILEVPLSPGPGRRRLRKREGDIVCKSPTHTVLIECKGSASTRSLVQGIHQLKSVQQAVQGRAIRLIAVPFMGDLGKRLCREAAISWMDLAGNADIRGSGLRIRIEGRPNLRKRPGRPGNVFAPKSSRVARQLLLDPTRPCSQRELARRTRLGEGFVSRIVKRLEEEGFVTRSKGAVQVGDPDLLLDAWQEAYSFAHHRIVRGHVAARSPQAALGQLAERLTIATIPYAATGLASAWQYTRFAGFRLVTVYVGALPSDLNPLNFRAEERGANVWLIRPDDEGVFDGSMELDGIRCVSAVQTWLDLLGQPERAREAAEELRKQRLIWKAHG